MLDALASVLLNEPLDLIELAGAFLGLGFGDRDADLSAGCRQRAAREAGVLTLDVEVSDFTEIEDAAIEVDKMVHPTLAHVMRQVVDHEQPRARGVLIHAGFRYEINVVDRGTRITVHEIDEAAADAFNRRDV